MSRYNIHNSFLYLFIEILIKKIASTKGHKKVQNYELLQTYTNYNNILPAESTVLYTYLFFLAPRTATRAVSGSRVSSFRNRTCNYRSFECCRREFSRRAITMTKVLFALKSNVQYILQSRARDWSQELDYEIKYISVAQTVYSRSHKRW